MNGVAPALLAVTCLTGRGMVVRLPMHVAGELGTLLREGPLPPRQVLQ
jgi:hypothetical protein